MQATVDIQVEAYAFLLKKYADSNQAWQLSSVTGDIATLRRAFAAP